MLKLFCSVNGALVCCVFAIYATRTGQHCCHVRDVRILSPKTARFLCKFHKQDTRNAEHGKADNAHETIRKVEHSKDDGENETIPKVDGFFKGKGHQLEDLTSKSLCIKPSSFVISTSDLMRDAVSESKCGGCGKSGKFEFLEETEPQTGVLKLEFICSDCQKLFSITSNNDIIRTRTRPKTYLTNYVLLAFIACGEYYKDYDHVMGTLGIGHFSEKQWIRVIEWIAPEVEKIAKRSVEQSRKLVRARGDQDKLEVMFDGFYLTRGHYSNNASATMHDAKRATSLAMLTEQNEDKVLTGRGHLAVQRETCLMRSSPI